MNQNLAARFRAYLFVGAAVAAVSCNQDAISPSATGPAAPLFDEVDDTSPRPHVYVHYDYLVFDGPNAHSDAPDPKAIQLVVDAYAAHGIDLVIDKKHTAIPGTSIIGMDPGNIYRCGDPSPYDLRSQYFHPTSNHQWHYAVFVDYVAGNTLCDPSFSSGTALINGDNFIVGLGRFRDIGLLDIAAVAPYAVGGTFMHELGHNLGLLHGGGDDINYKPNYLSVMNYQFQFGVWSAAMPGGAVFDHRRLDYSGFALPTLDENHLDERVGLSGPSNSTDLSFNACQLGGCGWHTIPTSGPIDWTGNGVIEPDVRVSLNWEWEFFNCLYCDDFLRYETLIGFDDWAAIRGRLAGTLLPGPKTVEHENRAEEPVVTGISPSSGPSIGGTTVTITGAHLTKAKWVMFGNTASTSFTIVNDKTIVAISPPVDPRGSTIDVIVVSGDAPSVWSGANPSPLVEADRFTYLNVLPRITGVTRTSGIAGTNFGPGGTVIVVTGSNFTGAHDVTFLPCVFDQPLYYELACLSSSLDDDVSSLWFTVVDDHTIVVKSPYEQLGYHNVRVWNAYGSNGPIWGEFGNRFPLVDTFQFMRVLPGIIGVSPGSGPESGGTAVTIRGDWFQSVTAVKFGSVNAASFTVVEDSTITALAPPGTGTVSITVSNWWGPNDCCAGYDRYTYTPPAPTVTSVSPTSGPVSGGTTITILGTGFLAATAVSVGHLGVASYTIVNDNTITAVTNPAGAAGPGTFNVTVTNAVGTSPVVASDQFTYF